MRTIVGLPEHLRKHRSRSQNVLRQESVLAGSTIGKISYLAREHLNLRALHSSLGVLAQTYCCVLLVTTNEALVAAHRWTKSERMQALNALIVGFLSPTSLASRV